MDDAIFKTLSTQLRSGKMSRRDFIQASVAAGLTVSAASVIATRAEAATPSKGGSLKAGVAHGATTDTLDPAVMEAGFMIPLGLAINGTLTEIDNASAIQPSVAESWDASADARTWVFRLRPGVSFHNGRDVTPEDVVASINYHRAEGSKSAAKPLVAGVKDIRIDGDQVVFELDSGNADFPAAMADYHFAICPATDDGIDWRSGVGCGAYKLEDFDPGVSAKLRRNPAHWTDAVAHVDEWEILSIIDTNARTTALIAGDVDVIDKLDPKTAGLMSRNPNVTIQTVAGNQHYSFPMRTDLSPFEDNRVRQAIKYAINREELVEKILFGYGSIGNDHPIGSGQRYFNTELEQKAYDPDRSRALLREAGLDGLKVELSASDAAFPGAVDAAVLIRESCAAAGIDVTVRREPNDGYWSEVWQKKPWCASYWAGRPVEDLMFSLAFKSGVSWNESFWSNAHFDELLVAARAELDPDKRRAMYYEMQHLVANEGGVVIPMFASYVFATSSRIGHPEVFASNQDLDGAKFIERWWQV